ncbi:MAG: hypothetical protein H7Y08_03845 [Rhizobiaceae bacterium]|nr:hypothetical protein [Rhizobiaceae bacterium]
MSRAADTFVTAPDLADGRYAEDVAALVQFSGYIAREAKRLGLAEAAEKARLVERDLLSALEAG